MHKYNFSNSFKDILNIVNSLSSKDKLYICNGDFKDSPYVKYRECILDLDNPIGFIEVYELPNEEYEFIVLAIKEEYRGKGISHILLNNMFEYYKNIEHFPFMWRCEVTNELSNILALKYNFKLINTTNNKNEYILNNQV